MTSDSAAIRAELECILASESFATAGRHSRLLRYLVERTLAGEGEQLKEYVLGTEVFDRADSYDPRLDSIVRVEVRRLRSRLEEYYRTTGADDPVVITIPRGSYMPSFESRSSGSVPEHNDDGRSSSRSVSASGVAISRPFSPATLIAAALTVLVVVFATGVALNHTRDAARASSTPGIAVLPFEHFSTNEQDALLVAHLTDAVTAQLARRGRLSVTSRTTAARHAGRPIREIASTLDVELVVESSAVVTGDVVHVVARIIDGRTDRKVWVGEYDVRRGDVPAAAARIAGDTAAAALEYVARIAR